MNFPLRISSVNGPNPHPKNYIFNALIRTRMCAYQGIRNVSFSDADLVTFTEEILNGKLHFLCSDRMNDLKIVSNEDLGDAF